MYLDPVLIASSSLIKHQGPTIGYTATILLRYYSGYLLTKTKIDMVEEETKIFGYLRISGTTVKPADSATNRKKQNKICRWA